MWFILYIYIYIPRLTNKNTKYLLLRIPSDETQRTIWLDFGSKWYAISEVNKNSVICSSHFEKHCFDFYKKSVQIKPNSVPSIVVQRVKHVRIIIRWNNFI